VPARGVGDGGQAVLRVVAVAGGGLVGAQPVRQPVRHERPRGEVAGRVIPVVHDMIVGGVDHRGDAVEGVVGVGEGDIRVTRRDPAAEGVVGEVVGPARVGDAREAADGVVVGGHLVLRVGLCLEVAQGVVGVAVDSSERVFFFDEAIQSVVAETPEVAVGVFLGELVAVFVVSVRGDRTRSLGDGDQSPRLVVAEGGGVAVGVGL